MQQFTPLSADAARFARRAPGDRWFVDETYVKVSGVWRYVYRAIDQDGQVIDVLISARRAADSARRFFQRALKGDTVRGGHGRRRELPGSSRGHCEIAAEAPVAERVAAAFTELSKAI